MNVAERHAHHNHENPQAQCQKPWMYKLLLCNTTANNLQNNKKQVLYCSSYMYMASVRLGVLTKPTLRTLKI